MEDNHRITPEDTKFVLDNVKTMEFKDIAKARGLSKHQVNKILMQRKKEIMEKRREYRENHKANELLVDLFLDLAFEKDKKS